MSGAIRVARVTESLLDDAFINMVRSTLPGGRAAAASRYLQDGEIASPGSEQRTLWQLQVNNQLAGWCHCGYQINHLTDPLGDPVVTIDTEFNYIYLRPEFRNQKLAVPFAREVGLQAASYYPLTVIDEMFAVLETGIPLHCTCHALCVNPGGKSAADAFAESVRHGVWLASQSTWLVLSDEKDNHILEDYLVID